MILNAAAPTGILDTNGVIGLAKSGCLALVPQFFRSVFVPPSVVREVKDPVPRRALDEALKTWLREQEPSPAALQRVPLLNRPADRHVLALAQHHPPSVIVTGDRALIRKARTLQVATVSAPGLIQLLAEAKLISAARPHLDQMIRLGFGTAPALYDEILQALGKPLPERRPMPLTRDEIAKLEEVLNTIMAGHDQMEAATTREEREALYAQVAAWLQQARPQGLGLEEMLDMLPEIARFLRGEHEQTEGS